VDIAYPAEVEAFREEVRRVLAELPPNWKGVGGIADPEAAEDVAHEWRQTLYRHGLLGITWPVGFGGRGLSQLHQVVLVEELARAGLSYGEPHDTFGLKMLGNTLLRWGTDDQKRRFLPSILSGDERWCQGYSEPHAGSDLAALSTRARRVGDDWVIDGQKVWTSAAHRAHWIFLLARTDPEATRSRGISFLLCPMDQPGVEVRPIRQMNGLSDFNEVFFSAARTSADNVVGSVGGGWAVAMTLLGHERGEEAATNPVLFRAELDRLFELAVANGRQRDPLIRQRLAWCYGRVEIMRFLGYRIVTQMMTGHELGAAASVSKLFWSEYHQRVTDLALDIGGLAGLELQGRLPLRAYRTDDPGAPNSTGSWLGAWYNARAGTIYAGSSQIQRNILAETVLGLPKEVRG